MGNWRAKEIQNVGYGKLFMEDFYNIPIFIKNIINEDYEYYIRTFSPWGGETILFCKPKKI